MKWHNPGMSITIQNCNMSAAKLETVKYSENQDKSRCISPLTDETSIEVPRCYLDFESGFPFV